MTFTKEQLGYLAGAVRFAQERRRDPHDKRFAAEVLDAIDFDLRAVQHRQARVRLGAGDTVEAVKRVLPGTYHVTVEDVTGDILISGHDTAGRTLDDALAEIKRN